MDTQEIRPAMAMSETGTRNPNQAKETISVLSGKPAPTRTITVTTGDESRNAVKAEVAILEHITRGAKVARDAGNEPSNEMTPIEMAKLAKSIVSMPGHMTLLGVSVQIYGEPRILFRLPRTAFYPPPRVRSAVIRIDVAPRLRADINDREAFFRVVRAGFGTRRKQLRNALAGGLRIPAATAAELIARAGLDPTQRPQELALDGWAALGRAWQDRGSPGGGP